MKKRLTIFLSGSQKSAPAEEDVTDASNYFRSVKIADIQIPSIRIQFRYGCDTNT